MTQAGIPRQPHAVINAKVVPNGTQSYKNRPGTIVEISINEDGKAFLVRFDDPENAPETYWFSRSGFVVQPKPRAPHRNPRFKSPRSRFEPK